MITVESGSVVDTFKTFSRRVVTVVNSITIYIPITCAFLTIPWWTVSSQWITKKSIQALLTSTSYRSNMLRPATKDRGSLLSLSLTYHKCLLVDVKLPMYLMRQGRLRNLNIKQAVMAEFKNKRMVIFYTLP